MSDKEVTKKESVAEARIPDLVKIGEIPSEYGQTVHTDIIDPVTSSQTSARFTLNRVAGFLHSNSKITFSVDPLTNTSSFYPLQVGVGQLIQEAHLRIGNKTVCSVQDFSTLFAYQSLFLTNENNKEREQYLSQRAINHGWNYTSNSDTSAQAYSLDLGRNPVSAVDDVVGDFNRELLPFQQHDGSSAETISEAPVYSLYLSDLFPFLRQNQIPAFMINDEIHIDLVFTPTNSNLAGVANPNENQSRRMCCSVGGTQTVAYQIDLNELKLVYDSISYDGEIMRKYAEQNPRISFSYVDYRLAKRTGDQTAFTNLTFPVGGNGRLVTKVIFGIQAHNNYLARSLMNGDGQSFSGTDGNPLSVNLRYNDRFEYSIDRNNTALLFHDLHHAEGQVPFVSRQEYSNEEAVPANPAGGVTALTSGTFEGNAQNSRTAGLLSNFSWNAIKPNRGERINNKGLDLVYKNTLAAGNYTLRCYLELMKVATIENGEFNCYFA